MFNAIVEKSLDAARKSVADEKTISGRR